MIKRKFILIATLHTCLKHECGAAELSVSDKYLSHENESGLFALKTTLDPDKIGDELFFRTVLFTVPSGLGIKQDLSCLIFSFFLILWRHFSLQNSFTSEWTVNLKGVPVIASPQWEHAFFRNSNRHDEEQNILLPFFSGSMYVFGFDVCPHHTHSSKGVSGKALSSGLSSAKYKKWYFKSLWEICLKNVLTTCWTGHCSSFLKHKWLKKSGSMISFTPKSLTVFHTVCTITKQYGAVLSNHIINTHFVSKQF